MGKINSKKGALNPRKALSPEISVCIPVTDGEHLRDSLDSIFGSNYNDFEVVVNDSSKKAEVGEVLASYDVKTIRKITQSLEGRYLTIKVSKGEKIFLMDETRVMERGLLERVAISKSDMLVVKERDIGKGPFIFLSNLDKMNLPEETSIMNPIENKSIIPRVYNRDIILNALEAIDRNISEEIRREIVGLDLELIYLESYNNTRDIEIISSPQILHYGDERISQIFRKYYRYGYSQSTLRGTYYRKFADLTGRNRSNLPLKNRISSLPIQLLRGIPFVLGYMKGENKLKNSALG